jgi:hypothetical protein
MQEFPGTGVRVLMLLMILTNGFLGRLLHQWVWQHSAEAWGIGSDAWTGLLRATSLWRELVRSSVE